MSDEETYPLTIAERRSLHPAVGDWAAFYAAVERIAAAREAAARVDERTRITSESAQADLLDMIRRRTGYNNVATRMIVKAVLSWISNRDHARVDGPSGWAVCSCGLWKCHADDPGYVEGSWQQHLHNAEAGAAVATRADK